jgi:predicted RNA-binding Zn-ribbon protein involved in translation (DUF1610 family)
MFEDILNPKSDGGCGGGCEDCSCNENDDEEKCPNCGSDRIGTYSVLAVGHAVQMYCDDCGHVWVY